MKAMSRIQSVLSWILGHTWVLLLVLLSLWAGRFLVERGGSNAERPADSSAQAPATIWTCSMHPQVRLPAPGACPICGMDLIPLADSSDPGGEPRQLKLSASARALAGVRTQPVLRRAAQAEVRMVGKLDYDETRLATITAWVGGRIERLFVDYTGVRVQKGDHLVEIYSPDLYSSQEELLQALRAVADLEARGMGDNARVARATLNAVREKLSLLGLRPEQVSAIEERGSASYLMTIYAPTAGIVIHRNAQVGMYVQTGSAIYTIADLGHLWVRLEAYESDLPWLRYGQPVEFTTQALPGEVFHGTIAFIDPVLDPRTRTVKVRVNVDNSAGRLKPEMFVRARVQTEVAAGGRVMDRSLAGKWICPMHPEVIKDEPGDCDICGMDLVTPESLGYADVQEGDAPLPLLIPVSAALVTGRRAIVYVEVEGQDGLVFEGREVVLGPRAGEHYLVERGLREGERVVVQGNFKIDSALQIQARPSMMLPQGSSGSALHDHEHPAGAPGEQAAGLSAAGVRALESVEAAFAQLEQRLAGGNMAAIQAAFAELLAAVDAVSADGFTGEARAVWGEIAMLLGNDASQGTGARDSAEAQALFTLALGRMWRLRAALGEHSGSVRSVTHAPQALAGGLRAQWVQYLDVAAALSADDPGVEPTARWLAALEALPTECGVPEQEAAWQAQRDTLRAAVASLAEGADLEARRTAFEPAAAALIELLGAWRVEGLTAFEVHCPMAFDGRGASWLQAVEDVRNPYYGSDMLACGSVLGRIPAAAVPSAAQEQHDH